MRGMSYLINVIVEPTSYEFIGSIILGVTMTLARASSNQGFK